MIRKLSILLLALLSVTAQAEVWQARYGVAETFNFKLYAADGTLDVDEADGGSEVSLSCNEGAETTATNDFADEGTFYSIALTATEMQCKRIAVVVAATTTEVFFIQTSGNASAMTPTYEANVASAATNSINAAALAADAGTEIGTAAWATTTRQLTSTQTFALTGNITGNLSGSVGSVTGAVGSVTGAVGSVTGAVGSVTGAVGSVASGGITEASFETTAGSFKPLGIIDQGTAQAYTGATPSLTLRSAAAFGDDVLEGVTAMICGSTQGYCQSTTIASNVGSTDVATLSAALPVAASGTVTYYLFGTASSAGGSGLDAAGVRSAIGLASANLDTQLSTIDTNVDDIETDTGTTLPATLATIAGYIDTEVAAILVDTGTTLDDLVDDLESRLGTPSNLGSGATVAANLADIEGQTDDIGVAGAGLTATDDAVMTRLGAPAGASVSADIAAVKVDTAATLADTGTDGVVVAAGSKTGYALSAAGIDSIWDEPQVGHVTADTFGVYLDSSVSGVSTGGVSASDIADEVATRTIAGVTLVNGLAANSITAAATAADFSTEIQTGLATSTAVADLPTNAELATALGTADDAVLAAIAALNDLSAADLRDLVIEDQGGGVSLGCALSVVLAYAAGDLSTTGSASTYEDPSGTETRATGTVASAGNRTTSITCPTY